MPIVLCCHSCSSHVFMWPGLRGVLLQSAVVRVPSQVPGLPLQVCCIYNRFVDGAQIAKSAMNNMDIFLVSNKCQ